MVGPIWWSLLLSVISVAVAALLVHGMWVGAEDRGVAGAHAAMALGMAGMFAPFGDPVPAPVGGAVFGVVAAWFLAVRLRTGGGTAAHTATAAAAMVVMYVGGHGQGEGAAGSAPAGHHAAASPGPAGLVGVGLSLLLIGYFLWHAWLSAGRLRDTVAPVERPAGRVLALRRTSPRAAHVVMDVLMAAMFLATV